MESCCRPAQLTQKWLKIPIWVQKNAGFYRLHLAYFIVLSFIGTLVLWLSPNKPAKFHFVDALYNAVSAMTVTGLVTVEMHRLSRVDEMTLLFLMVLGSQVFTSLIPVIVRRLSFCSDNEGFDLELGCLSRIMKPDEFPESLISVAVFPDSIAEALEVKPSKVNIQFKTPSKIPFTISLNHSTNGPGSDNASSLESTCKEGHERNALTLTVLEPFPESCKNDIKLRKRQGTCYRRHGKDKEEFMLWESCKLEHEALGTLILVVIIYFVGVQFVGFLACEICILFDADASLILKNNNINQVYFALFSSTSAFANAGFILLDKNMMPFQRSMGFVLCLSILILLGNTMFAPCLRLIIWLLHRAAHGRKKLVYGYLLKNPRRCYTHLFPRNQTVWLVMTVLMFNAFQMICFYALDWSSKPLKGLQPFEKIVDGIFQSITTRNAGMNVVTLAALSAPFLFLSVGMMYISVYPVFVTRQHSQETIQEEYKASKKPPNNDIYVQSRKLFARDSALLFIAIFFVCLVERRQISHDPLNFSVFNLIFEVVSGYGNVGLSIGYNCSLNLSSGSCKDVPYSLSGKWSVEGKLLLIIVMFLGRHRGLPENIDMAIRLPNNYLTSRRNSSQNLFRSVRSSLADENPAEASPATVAENQDLASEKSVEFSPIDSVTGTPETFSPSSGNDCEQSMDMSAEQQLETSLGNQPEDQIVSK